MHVQLTVDIGDADPRAAAAIVEALSPAGATAAAAGHRIQLTLVDNVDPRPTPEHTDTARRDWAEGFGSGFQQGFMASQLDPLQNLLPGVLSTAAGVFAHCAPAAEDTDTCEDSGPGEPETPATNTDPMAAFPDSMPAPYARALISSETLADLLPDPALTVSRGMRYPATAEETTTEIPPITDMFAAVVPDSINVDARVSGRVPVGPRPQCVPGAPVSAYNTLTAESANEAYKFPLDPFDQMAWIDDEGASWRFLAGAWQRQTWPREWGSAPSGDFPTVHLEH